MSITETPETDAAAKSEIGLAPIAPGWYVHADFARTLERERNMAESEVAALRAEVENWKESAAQFSRNSDFYRGLIVKIGETFGDEAKTADDGTLQDDVLALKVPELVEGMREDAERWRLARTGESSVVLCTRKFVELESPYPDLGGAMGDYNAVNMLVALSPKKADAIIDLARKESRNG